MRLLLFGLLLGIAGTAINGITNTFYALPLCLAGGLIFGWFGTEYLRDRRG